MRKTKPKEEKLKEGLFSELISTAQCYNRLPMSRNANKTLAFARKIEFERLYKIICDCGLEQEYEVFCKEIYGYEKAIVIE